MHSFRHLMRHRLRAVECPSDVIDQIGGWATEGVGQGSGRGYMLQMVFKGWFLDRKTVLRMVFFQLN